MFLLKVDPCDVKLIEANERLLEEALVKEPNLNLRAFNRVLRLNFILLINTYLIIKIHR
jgi:hypothetical protein